MILLESLNRGVESTQELVNSTSLPVDKLVEDSQASCLAKSLWNNIIGQSSVAVSK
jgi:hypothetical protein